jgi:hypothetical protein
VLLLFAAPADARSVVDATGRTVQMPDRIERVMPAGPLALSSSTRSRRRK